MNNEQMMQKIRETLCQVPNLYHVEYVRSGVGVFSGKCQCEFFANSRQELQEQLDGLIETFLEEYPESEYPNREMCFSGVFRSGFGVQKTALDILKEQCGERLYPERFKESRYETFNAEIYGIAFCVDEKYDRERKEKYLEGLIRWKHASRYTETAKFESSWEGYVQACEWIDEQRMRFAESLLGDVTD